MKNLQALMFPTVAIVWILLLWSCSMVLVKVQGYHLKSILDTEQKNIIDRWEEIRRAVILFEKQQISAVKTHAVDGLLLKRYKMLDLTESESLKHSFTSIQTKTNRLTSFGHISDTTAKTTKNLWNN